MKAISNYLKSSYEELTKVVWPTKNQAVKLTIIVLVFCLLMALFLALIDFGFGYLYDYLIKTA